MRYVNLMENIVEHKIMQVVNKNPEWCSCEQCISDMMCISLNKIKPKYVNTKVGEIMTKNVKISKQDEIDMLAIILESCKIVVNAPRHDPD